MIISPNGIPDQSVQPVQAHVPGSEPEPLSARIGRKIGWLLVCKLCGLVALWAFFFRHKIRINAAEMAQHLLS